MKLWIVLSAAFAVTSPTAQAHPINAPHLDLQGFELRETENWTISVLPQEQLQRHPVTATYRLQQNTLTLTSEARKPTAYHARQPKTELSESLYWRIADGQTTLGVSTHIEKMPTRGTVVLSELSSDDETPPVLRLVLDGDRVVLKSQGIAIPPNGVTIGTIGADHTAHIALHTTQDGHLTTQLNGSVSEFRFTPDCLTRPIAFHVGAHAIDDIGTTPDKVIVSLSSLSAHHTRSGLRSRS